MEAQYPVLKDTCQVSLRGASDVLDINNRYIKNSYENGHSNDDAKQETHLELEDISLSFSGLTRTATLMLQGWSPGLEPASPSAAETEAVASDEAAKGPVRRLNGDFLAGDRLARTETAFDETGSPAPERRLLGKAPRGFIAIGKDSNRELPKRKIWTRRQNDENDLLRMLLFEPQFEKLGRGVLF